MKYANKFIKSAPLLLLPIMGSALATDVTVPLTFTTLPVIEIEEKQAVAFGDVLSLTQAATCIMASLHATAGIELTSANEGTDVTDTSIWTNTPQTRNFTGNMTGGCSGAEAGKVGIYEIKSFKDANITVSVTAGSGTDITFVPEGYVTDLDEATGDVTRETLEIGTNALVNASTQLTAFSAEGTNRAIIGGTITNQNTLTAGDQYTADFNLNVVYQ